ncbi:unnamed protein product [Vicia faba]|uniref:Uncharacterized protein n=1 Tax=Vicia faba TaxID=3906 RepID=A0AAV0YSG8_VICFA|nr:unnamed protein product [Vicia faba]
MMQQQALCEKAKKRGRLKLTCQSSSDGSSTVMTPTENQRVLNSQVRTILLDFELIPLLYLIQFSSSATLSRPFRFLLQIFQLHIAKIPRNKLSFAESVRWLLYEALLGNQRQLLEECTRLVPIGHKGENGL